MIIALSRLCREESLHGLMKGKHAKSHAFGATASRRLSLKTRGGGGGGLGGVAYKDRARPPPQV